MSFPLPSRARFIEQYNIALMGELHALERVSDVTREEVTSDETRSEGKYDTRSTEASYLARGQAWRIAQLRQLVAWADQLSTTPPSNTVVCLGSLAQIESEEIAHYFVAPAGGTRITVDEQTVRVVSPDSPLGKALIGIGVDEDFQFESPAGTQSMCLLNLG